MQLKKISVMSGALTLLSAIGIYALLSLMGACLYQWEIIDAERAEAFYFGVGVLGVFFASVTTRRLLKTKKIWAAVITCLIYLLLVFLCGGRETAPARIWIYPGCGAGAALALMGGYKKRNRRGHEKRRRKK